MAVHEINPKFPILRSEREIVESKVDIPLFERTKSGYFEALRNGDMTSLTAFDTVRSTLQAFNARGPDQVATCKGFIKLISRVDGISGDDFGMAGRVVATLKEVDERLGPIGDGEEQHMAWGEFKKALGETMHPDTANQAGTIADYYNRLRDSFGKTSRERGFALDTILTLAKKVDGLSKQI